MMYTNIYEVTFKSGTVRYYVYDEDCKIGDTVVAATSHGSLLGQITDILDELPDDHDMDKMRHILCRVPEEGEVVAKPHQASVTERLSEIEQRVRKEHLAQLEQMMDEYMEKHKKEAMRIFFAEYFAEFKMLAKEYDKLNDMLYRPEEEDLSKETTENSETEKDGSGVSEGYESTKQCAFANPSIE